MKLNKVWPCLYIRGRSDQLPAADKLAALQEANIRRIFNLWSRPDPDLQGQAAWQYDHFSIPDGELRPATGEVLTVLAAGAAGVIRGGGSVLVQCHAGRNRSGLLAALIIRATSNLTGAEALAALREAKPTAVANPVFEAYLNGLEATE